MASLQVPRNALAKAQAAEYPAALSFLANFSNHIMEGINKKQKGTTMKVNFELHVNDAIIVSKIVEKTIFASVKALRKSSIFPNVEDRVEIAIDGPKWVIDKISKALSESASCDWTLIPS